MNDIFNLSGSNLFMIPCEIKNESFGEMFKRMITKNGILCIALYRKNLIDNFYYVYTNPKKTTLIKDTDYIFILAGTESIESYYEQNKFKINKKNNKDKENEFNNNKGEEKGKEKPAFFKVLQESMKKQYIQMRKSSIIDNSFNSIDERGNNINNMNIINFDEENKLNDINLFIEENLKKISSLSNEEKSQKKYKEIEELQNQVNKTMEKLKQLNMNFNEFENIINSYVKDEVKNELLIYLNKAK